MRTYLDICAIISARNESETLLNVYRQLHRAGVQSCVTVVNGSTDDTYRTACNGSSLFVNHRVMHFDAPLGHDVPRAIGAYTALRSMPFIRRVVFIDGDWLGSFGPALSYFIDGAIESDVDAQYIPYRNQLQGVQCITRESGIDEQIWMTILNKKAPELCGIAPSHAPVMFNTRIFRYISPSTLAYPGRFFAYAVLRHMNRQIRIGVDPAWDIRVCGNRTRSAVHGDFMRMTVVGDSVEGACILKGERMSRTVKGVIHDGYHTSRRMDILKQWQSKLRVETGVRSENG